jgi:hypothetical protein
MNKVAKFSCFRKLVPGVCITFLEPSQNSWRSRPLPNADPAD